MKKNFLIFIIILVFVATGLCSRSLWAGVRDCVSTFASDTKSQGVFNAFESFCDSMEDISSEKLRYHSSLMNINSAFLRAVNTRIVVKDDTAVVRTASGSLANPRYLMQKEVIKDRADKVGELYNISVQKGAEFLYVMAPPKGYDLQFPSNISDFTKQNCSLFAKELDALSVPVLNLITKKAEQGITDNEMFFVTDHHWRPRYGLWASDEIQKELGRLYGYQYDTSLGDISNYNIKTYKNWFLGSQGKKVGAYFTSPGVDDIELIVPDFETSLTEEQPLKNHFREGDFCDTVLYTENIETKDYYNLNPYVAYSGGDFREQIINNKLMPDGKKILLIRDSFACAAVPFLSLGSGKLYVTDVRDYEYYVGSKINISEYIDKIKPDYVVVLYNGISTGEDLFNFN